MVLLLDGAEVRAVNATLDDANRTEWETEFSKILSPG